MLQDLTVSIVLICKPSPEAVCKLQYVSMARHREYYKNNKSLAVNFFLNPICILLVVCTSTIAVCIVIYANKILFKLSLTLYHKNNMI